VSEWITDRLPEHHGCNATSCGTGDHIECLCTVKGLFENFVVQLSYVRNRHAKTAAGQAPRWKLGLRDYKGNVIAWQPLPEPYQP
jgi:hypothetical protein